MDDFRKNLAIMNAASQRRRNEKIAQGFVLALIIGVFLLIFVSLTWNAKMREAECTSIGGTYMTNGRYGEPTCVKNGRIVIIWKNDGTKVENP